MGDISKRLPKMSATFTCTGAPFRRPFPLLRAFLRLWGMYLVYGAKRGGAYKPLDMTDLMHCTPLYELTCSPSRVRPAASGDDVTHQNAISGIASTVLGAVSPCPCATPPPPSEQRPARARNRPRKDTRPCRQTGRRPPSCRWESLGNPLPRLSLPCQPPGPHR